MQPPTPSRMPRWLAIAVVSLSGLLLEIGYTRIVSYKLWYYYTYLVIGLALLGIGSGGVIVAVSARLRSWATDRIVAVFAVWGAISIGAGYALVAWMPINTLKIWDYGTAGSLKNLFLLGLIAFLLFAAFIAIGIIVSTILGRGGDDIGRLYFADLVGAGIACLVAIPLIARLGPPSVIMLAALLLALIGIVAARPSSSVVFVTGVVASLVLAACVVNDDLLPDVDPEAGKWEFIGDGALYSEWGPVFRVDVLEIFDPDNPVLVHDGTYGSGLHRFDGDASKLTQYETDPRAIPFDVLGGAPERELIIGSAGGQEILTSLYYGAPDIEAVELNPVTVSLLTDHFADFTGHLPDRPEVDLTLGDGRSYLARSDEAYDLVWYVAPDSYAATNAASSGAFVLSESYLYTSEMIERTLEHLTDDGIMVVQFGELDFDRVSNRTSRYVVTARDALEHFGVDDPTQHIAVAVQNTDTADLSTIVVKRTPFTPEEVERFVAGLGDIPDTVPVYALGTQYIDHEVARLAAASPDELDALVAASGYEIDAVTDDAPFFWHFNGFGKVLSEITDPIRVVDPEDAIGERVLLLLFAVAVVYAAIFLLLPFFVVRRQWRALPAKGVSAVYFAALGLGFMFYEITMIQRMTRLLGYPTYSLTVTLASILVTAGLGSMLSERLALRARSVMPILLGTLAVLTLLYQLLLDPITDSLQSASLAARVTVTVLLLAPLGLCLGMFMPFGLGAVNRLSTHDEEYVAWSWAVNGFFSVIGSVLTTILAMTFGFRLVQYLAFVVYAVAVVTFTRLHRRADRAERAAAGEPVPLDVTADPASTPAPA